MRSSCIAAWSSSCTRSVRNCELAFLHSSGPSRRQMRTTRSGESALLLLDAIELLIDGKIEYAVIGALAASIQGAVRASMDADVVLSTGMREADALERASSLRDFAPY